LLYEFVQLSRSGGTVLEKSTEAFKTIGEMAAQLGVKTHILRYWEEQFPMLQPLKRAGGRRHYRPEDVVMLITIRRLLAQDGYTIKGARQFLLNGVTNVMSGPTATDTLTQNNDTSLRALQGIRDRLSAALEAA
jgi:DNA-binding transcriptional MerR regulator